MKRYNNPLLEVWFSKNGAVINSKTTGKKVLDVAKECVGMRQGCSVDPAPAENGYKAYSKFQVKYMPRNFFKVTEVYFLLAEAKLRNWNVGATSAKDFYEKGIGKSLQRTDWQVRLMLILNRRLLTQKLFIRIIISLNLVKPIRPVAFRLE